MLTQDRHIGFGDGIGFQPTVRGSIRVLATFPMIGGDPAIDHEMRDVNALGVQFTGQALG